MTQDNTETPWGEPHSAEEMRFPTYRYPVEQFTHYAASYLERAVKEREERLATARQCWTLVQQEINRLAFDLDRARSDITTLLDEQDNDRKTITRLQDFVAKQAVELEEQDALLAELRILLKPKTADAPRGYQFYRFGGCYYRRTPSGQYQYIVSETWRRCWQTDQDLRPVEYNDLPEDVKNHAFDEGKK